MTTRRNRKDHTKTQKRMIKINTFKDLKDNEVPNKGIHYSVQHVDVLSTNPNVKGDLVKKYTNGKLVEQKFVTEDKLKKFIHTSAEKSINKMKFKGGEKTQVVYVQAPPQNATKDPEVVNVQDKTTFGQYMKQGFALNAGATFFDVLFKGIFEGFNDN
jgi:hypothetical protein